MASHPSSIVVVGGGLAGAKAVQALREQGYRGALTLLSGEDELPYERPPLSKEYLQGKQDFDAARVHPQEWYTEHDVDLQRGTVAVAVRPAEHTVDLLDGGRISYEALVLATGSEPRTLPIDGGDTVLSLRTHEDSDALRLVLAEGKRIVVIGAGWIGLEVAAAAKQAGAQVTVLESAELPLLGVLGREIATVFAELHRENGVDLRLGAEVAEVLQTGGSATGVRLADGTVLEADAVIAGVGAAPRLELATSAGLAIDDGVLVDAQLRTSDPAIWAVGDIASPEHPVYDRRVRVEHWANAQNQPAVAAAAILGGDDTYDNLPYFFSDQFDLGMEYSGYAPPGSYARVLVRGDLAGREFVAFWLDASDRILAAMNVNVWDVLDDIKPLIADRVVIDPDKLTDPELPFSALR